MTLEPGSRVEAPDGRSFIAYSFVDARGYKTWWVRDPSDFAPEALSGFDLCGEPPPEDYPAAKSWLYLIPEDAEPLPADAPPPSRPFRAEPTPAPEAKPDLGALVGAYVKAVFLFGSGSSEAFKIFLALARVVKVQC